MEPQLTAEAVAELVRPMVPVVPVVLLRAVVAAALVALGAQALLTAAEEAAACLTVELPLVGTEVVAEVEREPPGNLFQHLVQVVMEDPALALVMQRGLALRSQVMARGTAAFTAVQHLQRLQATGLVLGLLLMCFIRHFLVAAVAGVAQLAQLHTQVMAHRAVAVVAVGVPLRFQRLVMAALVAAVADAVAPLMQYQEVAEARLVVVVVFIPILVAQRVVADMVVAVAELVALVLQQALVALD